MARRGTNCALREKKSQTANPSHEWHELTRILRFKKKTLVGIGEISGKYVYFTLKILLQ